VSRLSDRRVALAALIALVAPLPLMAQTPTRPATARIPASQSCDMSARVLMLSLVDARTGAPLREGAVTVHLKSTGAKLRDGQHFPGKVGDWIVLEDGDLARSATPVAVEIVVRHAGRTVRHTVEVGTDAAGCHIGFTRAPGVLRI
jgi:hypothetical protein